MTDYRVFWGEAHDNTYQFPTHRAGAEPTHIATAIDRAAAHLDFYAAAYYTSQAEGFAAGGHPTEGGAGRKLINEDWKPAERLDAEWAEVQDATRAANDPGRFVTFPGYEWQGDGTSGDHNVFARREGLEIFRVDTLAELYDRLRGRDVIAIPHHVAYRPGVRGRDWSVFDPQISPFCEIYSLHGCSETDEEWIGMRSNPHLGPGVGASTWQSALDRGLRLGCIASTDNWGRLPGHYGRGRCAVLASELTRDALWEAFCARRVYGVTGDRIELDFRVNDAVMGGEISATGPRRIAVRVVGSDALDRIELLRNGRVIATHCHQGSWSVPAPGAGATRWKMRVECGWGPSEAEIPMPERQWRGRVTVAGGRMLAAEPCWVSPGQRRAELAGESAELRMVSGGETVGAGHQNAEVLEFQAATDAEVRVELNGLVETARVAELARASRVLWYRDECAEMLRGRTDIDPDALPRADLLHSVAYKCKLHRPIPAAGYTAEWTWTDAEPLAGGVHYRVRVEQRNGQRAWSSPIWVALS